MIVYLTTFITSYLLSLYAELLLKKGRQVKKAKNILFISVLIVAIIAGIRANSVGTDTISYTSYYIERGASIGNIEQFFIKNMVFEPGFNLFSYCIGMIFHFSSHWFLFWCAMIIYGFTMMALYYYHKSCSISFAWLFFLMLNCTEAFNITRQYMAFALAAYAFTFVFKKNIKLFCIWTIIAMTFHVSAAFCFLLYLVYFGLSKYNTLWYKTLVVVGTVAIVFLYLSFFQLFAANSFIGAKMGAYFKYTRFSLQVNPLMIRLPFIIVVMLHKKSFCKLHLIHVDGSYNDSDNFGDFLFLILIIDLILSQLRGFNEVLYRIVVYTAVLKYVSYSIIINMSRFQTNKTIKRAFAYIFVAVVFWYWVIELNSGCILPYISDVLGINAN